MSIYLGYPIKRTDLDLLKPHEEHLSDYYGFILYEESEEKLFVLTEVGWHGDYIWGALQELLEYNSYFQEVENEYGTDFFTPDLIEIYCFDFEEKEKEENSG
jgi:hypothetical protein